MTDLTSIWVVRCYACGGPIAPARDQYEKLLASLMESEEAREKGPIETALDQLGFRRTCCRMYIICPGQLAPGLYVEGGAKRQSTAITVGRSSALRPAPAPKGQAVAPLFPRLIGKPVAVLAPGTVAAPAPIAQVTVNEAEVPKRPFRAN